MRKVCVSFLFGFILLVSCSSTPKTVYKSSHSIELPVQIVLDLGALKKSGVALNSPGYDGEKIADTLDLAKEEAGKSAERTAQQSSYPMPAGSGYIVDGVSTAMVFVMIPIMRSIEEKKAQNRKNEPVKKLLARIESINWELYTNELIKESVGVPVYLTVPNINKANGNTLWIYPYLEITSSYHSIELHALVIVNSVKNDVLYSNYFHVQSLPIIKESMNQSDLNLVSEQQIKATVFDLFKKMLPLIYTDLRTNEVNNSVRDIRFRNHMGRYYARGKLLKRDKEARYITFKTSRGEVKSYPYLSNTISSKN